MQVSYAKIDVASVPYLMYDLSMMNEQRNLSMTLTKQQVAVIYKKPMTSKADMRKLIEENIKFVPQDKITICAPSKKRKIR